MHWCNQECTNVERSTRCMFEGSEGRVSGKHRYPVPTSACGGSTDVGLSSTLLGPGSNSCPRVQPWSWTRLPRLSPLRALQRMLNFSCVSLWHKRAHAGKRRQLGVPCNCAAIQCNTHIGRARVQVRMWPMSLLPAAFAMLLGHRRCMHASATEPGGAKRRIRIVRRTRMQWRSFLV